MSDPQPAAPPLVELRTAALSAALRAIPGQSAAIHRLRARLGRLLEAADVARTAPIALVAAAGPTRSAAVDAIAVAIGRQRQAAWQSAPVQRFAASTLAQALHHDRLFGLDKVVAPGGDTLHGLLEAAEWGLAVVEDADALEPVAARALADALATRTFRRRGDSRDRVLAARVVLVVAQPAALAGVEPALRALMPPTPLEIPALSTRLADTAELLAAAGLTHLDPARVAAVTAHVLTQRPDDQERAALVAGADPELLDPIASSDAPATAATALDVPAAIAEGSATLEDVKAWYIQRVRAASATDVDAARRLDVHRATIAKYVRPGD